MRINKLIGDNLLDEAQIKELTPYLETRNNQGFPLDVTKSCLNLCNDKKVNYAFLTIIQDTEQIYNKDLKSILIGFILYKTGELTRAHGKIPLGQMLINLHYALSPKDSDPRIHETNGLYLHGEKEPGEEFYEEIRILINTPIQVLFKKYKELN